MSVATTEKKTKYRGALLVRMRRGMLTAMRELARRNGRPLNWEIEQCCLRTLKRAGIKIEEE